MKLRIPLSLVKIATYIKNIKNVKNIAEYRLFILALLAGIILLIAFYSTGDKGNKGNKDIENDIGNMTVNVTVYSGSCPNCHNISLSRSGVDANRCNICHEQAPHGDPKPPSRFNDMGKKTIHKQHYGSVTNQKNCLGCHSPPACNRCHSGHASTPEFNVSKTCQECHGGFPEPKGHQEQRSTFKISAHSWMGRCNTCHKGTGLGFKSLATYNLGDSSKLCSNCHPEQYKDTNHYTKKNVSGTIIEDKKCVDCHNPHTVAAGTKISLEESSSSSLSSVLKKKFNDFINLLVNNVAWTVLIILLICSIVIEYIFRPKEGNIILSKGLRVEHDKSKARAIRIISSQKLSSSILRELTNILDNNDVGFLGISAGNEDAVLFVSVERHDKKKVIDDIRSLSGILKAEYTKDYDIR